MITAGHVVDNSGRIAIAKHLTERITKELLRIRRIPKSNECKNILLGKVILTFAQYFDQIENKKKVISFVRMQLKNKRNVTRSKVMSILKKFER